MQIYNELLCNEIGYAVASYLRSCHFNAGENITSTALEILEEVKKIICDDHLTDFLKVDHIVKVLNNHNISTGSCHLNCENR